MRGGFGNYYLLISTILLACSLGCKPKKLENGRAIAEEVERRTVKRFTEKQIAAEARRFGDSLTHFADSLLAVRLQKSLTAGGVVAGLKNYPPENYPEVKAFAAKYGGTLQRKKNVPETKNMDEAQISPLSQTEMLYSRPIFLNREACLSCHGPNVTAANKQQLQAHDPAFVPGSHQTGDLLGVWYYPIKRKAVLENLTLRGMKKPRPRSEKQ